MMHSDMDIPTRYQTWDHPSSDTRHGTYPLLLTSGSHHWRPIQTCSLQDLTPPKVLTSSGGHQNMYGCQAGGMHPTGMPSCVSEYVDTLNFCLFIGLNGDRPI